MVIFGRNRLYVITRGVLSDFCLVSIIRSILLSRLIFSRCLLINDVWSFQDVCWSMMNSTLVLRSCFSFLRLLLKFIWFELIRLIRMAWLKGIFHWFYVKVVLSISLVSFQYIFVCNMPLCKFIPVPRNSMCFFEVL